MKHTTLGICMIYSPIRAQHGNIVTVYHGKVKSKIMKKHVNILCNNNNHRRSYSSVIRMLTIWNYFTYALSICITQ